jgi:crotonobetainyl-CoA:carnitine CoA-transferase CaiB-like acyl-CoA transferase
LGIAAEALGTIPFGDTQLVGQPFSMNRTPSSIVSPPPSRGQHTEDILADLGISDSGSLKRNNVI